MSRSASAYLVVGVPVTRAAFWTPTGKTTLVCRRGHRVADGRFCPDCGTPTERCPLEAPTPAFAVFAKRLDQTPEDVWSGDHGWACGETVGGLRLYDGRAGCYLDRDVKPDVPLVLGLPPLLRASDLYYPDQQPHALPMGAITEALDRLCHLLQTSLDVGGIPQVYLLGTAS